MGGASCGDNLHFAGQVSPLQTKDLRAMLRPEVSDSGTVSVIQTGCLTKESLSSLRRWRSSEPAAASLRWMGQVLCTNLQGARRCNRCSVIGVYDVKGSNNKGNACDPAVSFTHTWIKSTTCGDVCPVT